MKIPKSLNILGMKVKIVFKDLEGTGACGAFSSEQKTIYLCKSLKSNHDELIRCLLHECGHAIIYRSGVFCTGIPECLEEVIVETFANGLYEAMGELGLYE